ncbi:Hypothetical protein CINCED_3A015477 [Cinara cedri]|uniref:Uncharacterized protein n=1 Tax=Cinara cedri TaxID=506608 RepID=A0A5E4M958_9HEMI|nr:Hypothetical protein CINCED_3A015477 [Cinara cedri]
MDGKNNDGGAETQSKIAETYFGFLQIDQSFTKHQMYRAYNKSGSTCMSELSSENTTLRVALASINNRVLALDTAGRKMATPPAVSHISQLLLERSERQQCLCNIVVVHGLHESSKLLLATRPDRTNDVKPRPLKAAFPSKEQALRLVRDFNTKKRSLDLEILILESLEAGSEVDNVYIDFSKASHFPLEFHYILPLEGKLSLLMVFHLDPKPFFKSSRIYQVEHRGLFLSQLPFSTILIPHPTHY